MLTALADITAIIDTLVSTTWIFMTYLCLLIVLVLVFTVYKPFRTKWHNYILPTFFSFAALFSLIYLTRGPYGKAVEFIAVESNGKQVVLIERHEVGDGDAGTTTMYRLYVLELNSGNRTLRQVQSYPGILCLKDSMAVMIEHDAFVGYDLASGDAVKTWSKESGFNPYPELSVGINNLSYVSRRIGHKKTGYILITSMDGNQFYFDVLTEKLHRGNYPPSDDTFSEYSARIGKIDYRFGKETGAIERMIREEEGDATYFAETFLDPKIIAIHDSVIVVRHYETMEKKFAIITAMDLNVKKLWEVKQRVLTVPLEDDPVEAGATTSVDGKLIVTLGGWVICIRAVDGKILWKTNQ